VVTSSTPIFACADIETTLAFYKDVLGFTASWTWGDPPTFGSASWGAVTIMFSLQPDLARQVTGHQHWINVEHVDDLHAKHLERGAFIVSPIEDKPWGRREYTVQDPNGYHLRFAGDPAQAVAPSTSFPEGVKIVRRKPTEDEHLRVAASTFYQQGVPEGVLDRTWQGVVALSPSGDAIGTVRIVYDAPGWFSIWDVAVLPEWQGQRIGAAMMKEAIEIVREASPGAWVYLFTYKHAFYERLGFTKESVSMLKV
jgi:ribosomal protein S18 acetylase RimI-like enzyme